MPGFRDFVELSILGITDPDGDPVTVGVDSIFQDEATGGLFEGDVSPDALLLDLENPITALLAQHDPAGDGRVYTANFTARDGIGGICQGTVKLCFPIDPGASCGDGGPEFDSTKEAEIDLSVSIIDSPDPVNVGDELTYNITVNNKSPLIATAFGVTDELPPGVDFVSASTGCEFIPSNTTICSHGPLAGGTSTTDTIIVRPHSMGAITNRARVWTSREFSIDPNSANDTATVTTTVGQTSGADLAVTMTDSPDPLVRGGAVTYIVTATNKGPAPATNVVLTDALPPLELNDANILVSQGTFTRVDPDTITCNLGTLASGASATLTVKGYPFSAGTITNTASVTAHEPDPNPANNSASEDTTVNSTAEMLLVSFLDRVQLSSACHRVEGQSERLERTLDIFRKIRGAIPFWSWRTSSSPN